MNNKIGVNIPESKALVHHGIKGQRWGVRRYQNEDGSLTSVGKKRQADQESKGKQKNKEATSNRRKEIGKKIGIASGAVLGTAGITAAAIVGGKFIEKQIGKMLFNSARDYIGKSILDIDGMVSDIVRGR